MLPSEAAQLVLRATELAKPGEIFVLKMKAVKIGDLAEACRDFFAKLYGKDPENIKIVKIGSNPGEKIHEELMSSFEALNAIETDYFYILNPHPERKQHSVKPLLHKGYTSNTAPLLSKNEIISLLSQLFSI
jgi:FlaA1/EpsC-like NDP-sugar epimerase